MFDRISTYLKEARLELKKVSWPKRQETVRYTVAVIAMSLALAAFLGGLDFAFTYILQRFIL